jgi:uncharacterized protein (UPF0335 family)
MADGINAERLINITDRVERLLEEIKGIQGDVKDLFTQAKAEGLEPKYIKKCLALKRMDSEKRRLEEAELGVYMAALGIE